MRPRLPILLLLVYVILDFGNPLMPGAVNFGADESVDGVPHHRDGGPVALVAVSPPAKPDVRPRRGVSLANRPGPARPVPIDRILDARHAQATATDLHATPTEDH
jgi:hypothetical protein